MPRDELGVLIPSYNRPRALEAALRRWRSTNAQVLVVADADNEGAFEAYKDVLEGAGIRYELRLGRRGSARARNDLIKLAIEEDLEYALMADDDYVPPGPFIVEAALEDFKYEGVGAVGGRVVHLRRRAIDPDFFFNLPVADALTRLTGYVFLDVAHGPRYAGYLTPFYAMRREVLMAVKYDERYKATAFREESDVHNQIKRLGYKLLHDPKVYVYHLAPEEGGNRALGEEGRRFYWKARNHALFLGKWERGLRRAWHLFAGALILTAYRPWHAGRILRGIRDGLEDSSRIS